VNSTKTEHKKTTSSWFFIWAHVDDIWYHIS